METGKKKWFVLLLLFMVFCACGPAQAAKINRKNLTIRVGKTYRLKITGTKKKVKWHSANKKIATVNSKGLVKGRKKGKTKIVAKVGKKKFVCKVTVKAKASTTAKTTASSGQTGSSGTGTETLVKKDDSSSKTKTPEETVYEALIAMKKKYPEGTTWTNSKYYRWNGGIYYGGFGCAAFVFMLSDAAFGDAQASIHYDVDEIRVGDILRIDYDTHSVIVLTRTSSYVTVAEGNYGGKVHWGRKITISQLKKRLTYVMTRYEDTSGKQNSGPGTSAQVTIPSWNPYYLYYDGSGYWLIGNSGDQTAAQ